MTLDKRDMIFVGLLASVLIAILSVQHKRAYQPTISNAEPVVDIPDTETVGMSLSVNPSHIPGATPFHGRYPLPAPLMGMNPSTTADALQGTALNQGGNR